MQTESERKVIMQNYIGVGVDAKVALEWHRRRQSAPEIFTSRIRNKLHYARYGAKQLFRRDFPAADRHPPCT